MLQFQDNDNTNQDMATTADNGVFFPQLNNVCLDWNINESDSFALQGTVIPQEKELSFGSLQCSCNSLPTTYPDPSWNMGYQFGGNQYTPSACCPFEQTKKLAECAPPLLSDIEPFLGKDIESKHIDYGAASAKQVLSNSSNDCRLFSCMQPLSLPMYNAPFPTQDASLMQFNAINTNSYNFCLENDCFDPCSTSKSQFSSCVLEPNLDISNIRSENVERVSDCNPDLSSFISLDSGNDTILNVNDTDEESDIIVEDSDTESEVSIDVGPYMIDKEVTKEAVMRCFVCNLSYSEKLDFVQVNSSFPLTFISQTPVMLKLIEIIPIDMQTSVKFENSLICKRCLNLIDMTENLELRLVSVKKALCDFVSRSSKDVTDEDWSLIQGPNDICIEDNIVKNIEPLVSEKVKDVINISTTETEKTPTMETSDKNVNENLSNDNKKDHPEPVEAKLIPKTIDDSVANNNVDSISITDKASDFNKYTDKISVTDDPNGILTKPVKKTDFNQSLPINAKNDTSNQINTEPKKVWNRIGGYQCDRCGKVFRCEKELMSHLRKHAGEFIEKCIDCGKGFMKKNNLEVHMRKHRKHICIHCRASFDSDIQLEGHSKNCTENKVSCLECKLVFTSEIKLENHLKKHKFKSNICSVCNKSFKHPSYLVAHMKCHSDEKPFSCQKCGRNYKNQNHLRRHLKSHDFSLRCSKCHKVFSCPLELKKHLYIHEEEMECEICKKKFSKKYLSEHMKIHQNNKKKKECPVCKKMLTASIKVHMLTHAETKRYKCEICSVEFTFKHSLTKHIRLKHKS